ncbi:MAG: tyrosine-protein phosphatase [Rhodobacteraceae bacterium]|nr:tyrosine-protein phosphatase [Paracoccaceae bacterium]
MPNDNQRHLPLAGAYNIRDLGGYATWYGPRTSWRQFLRADSPHRLSRSDLNKLIDEGLSSVIDLRSANEVAKAPNPFAKMDGVRYRNIPLFDRLAPDNMRPNEHAASDDPLLDFYCHTLETRQVAIGNALRGLAEAGDGAVMFHCTAGKDRTGLIAALLLGLAGVNDDDIIADYVETRALIADLVLEFLEHAKTNGTDLDTYRKLLECNPTTMRRAIAHLRRKYRSVARYMTEIGLEADIVGHLRNRLLTVD